MLSNILYVFTHGGGSNSDKGDDAKDCFVGGGDDVGAPPLPPEQLLQLMQQQQQITAAHPPPQLCCTQCTVHPPLQCCRTGLRCRAGEALVVLQLSRQRTRSCLPSTFTDPPAPTPLLQWPILVRKGSPLKFALMERNGVKPGCRELSLYYVTPLEGHRSPI